MASQQLVAPKLKNVNMRDKRTSPQSDDSALVRQIRETHSPGRSHSVNVNQILQVIEEIFHRASHSTAGVLVVVPYPICFCYKILKLKRRTLRNSSVYCGHQLLYLLCRVHENLQLRWRTGPLCLVLMSCSTDCLISYKRSIAR